MDVKSLIFQNLLNHSSSDKPENQAWSELIKKISLWGKYLQRYSIAIIVNSDLENLEKYNSREEPFYLNYTLPQNMSFIYASAERDLDNPMNKMIKIADFGATFLLDLFIKSQQEEWVILCYDDIKIWTVEQTG